MPAKYSHAKKRSAARKSNTHTTTQHSHGHAHGHAQRKHAPPNPLLDRSLTQALGALATLERCIARILLLRYEQDIARLFSTRLYCVALLHVPTLLMRCMAVGGPGWAAHNADSDAVKDFFRAAIAMDMRQAGERVATKSVLWSYTVLRHFALANGVAVCRTRGLHSMHLLPHYAALKTHLDALDAAPPPAFAKPAHLGGLADGLDALEDACALGGALDGAWRAKVRAGYERLVQTLWRVAREFDARGYGLVLREKLVRNWCECGCSTDHLGEVCERAVREDEQENGVRSGKQREWDGRGSGVYGWGTEEEEDIWEAELDFVGSEQPEDGGSDALADMSIGERMEWRYLRAEREKEQGNVAFKKGDFERAITHYVAASKIEPEMPHYHLNLAAAHLKLSQWVEAETACDRALSQHRSGKGYFRRARARKMRGQTDGAIKDLRAALLIQPRNAEARTALAALLPDRSRPPEVAVGSSSSSHAHTRAREDDDEALGLPRAKPPKPLPFAKTEQDARRLKIAPLPITLDLPEDMGLGLGEDAGRKGKAGNAKGARAQMQTMSFSYPSWERYVIQRVD
ncbi:hypothetical protein DENSPDRAFT_900352 [Dentipellis sp. KUC8613]|nr:hypothetical protein DENSPDRAFT_900352 [Dentipellis sp. KUC8613]